MKEKRLGGEENNNNVNVIFEWNNDLVVRF